MTNMATQSFPFANRSFPFVPGQGLSALVTPPASTANPAAQLSGIASDTVTLSTQAQNHHLFEGLSTATASVKVQPWGTGEDDCLERILAKQGYSREEIYAKNSEGLNMLQQVASANNLRNPNVVPEGFELQVPTKLVADDTSETESCGVDEATDVTPAWDDSPEAYLEEGDTEMGLQHAHPYDFSDSYDFNPLLNFSILDNFTTPDSYDFSNPYSGNAFGDDEVYSEDEIYSNV